MADLVTVILVFLALMLIGMSILIYYMTGVLIKINHKLKFAGADKETGVVKNTINNRLPVNSTVTSPTPQPSELKMVSLKQKKGNRNHILNGELIDLKGKELVELEITVDSFKSR